MEKDILTFIFQQFNWKYKKATINDSRVAESVCHGNRSDYFGEAKGEEPSYRSWGDSSLCWLLTDNGKCVGRGKLNPLRP